MRAKERVGARGEGQEVIRVEPIHTDVAAEAPVHTYAPR